jgi:transcription-repair coupling factor (superfamily II helicase)
MKKIEKIIQIYKEVNIDTDFELMLPDSYVNSTEERLSLYQKLAEIQPKKNCRNLKMN